MLSIKDKAGRTPLEAAKAALTAAETTMKQSGASPATADFEHLVRLRETVDVLDRTTTRSTNSSRRFQSSLPIRCLEAQLLSALRQPPPRSLLQQSRV